MSFRLLATAQPCPVCRGRRTDSNGKLCPKCHGAGEITPEIPVDANRELKKS